MGNVFLFGEVASIKHPFALTLFRPFREARRERKATYKAALKADLEVNIHVLKVMREFMITNGTDEKMYDGEIGKLEEKLRTLG